MFAIFTQSYNKGGFNYIEKLNEFADSGFPAEDAEFIKAVISIVQVGCHNPRKFRQL